MTSLADIVGALEARAQELIDTTTGSIYSHVSTFLSTEHRDVFAFLLALQRLHTTHKLTDHEMSLWMSDMIPGSTPPHLQSITDVCPQWITQEVVFIYIL